MIPQVAPPPVSGESSAVATTSATLPKAPKNILPKQAEKHTAQRLPKKRKRNPHKPPSVKGHKWSAKGAGFDCKSFVMQPDGETRETYLAHLGKREWERMRAATKDRAELRRLVEEWVSRKHAEKGW